MYSFTIKYLQKGETWYPNTCQTCTCTSALNSTSGFHVVDCQHKACPEIDESQCQGTIATTEDGCCKQCITHNCVDASGNVHEVQREIFLQSALRLYWVADFNETLVVIACSLYR